MLEELKKNCNLLVRIHNICSVGNFPWTSQPPACSHFPPPLANVAAQCAVEVLAVYAQHIFISLLGRTIREKQC